MESQITQQPKSKVLIAGVLVIVALLVIVAGIWYAKAREKVTAIEGGKITAAAPGKLISGFPEELLPESGVVFKESYKVNMADVSQPVASYVSSKNLKDNIDLFGAKLKEGGWLVIREADLEQAVTNIYAVKGDKEANITFSVGADGAVRVTIAQTSGK